MSGYCKVELVILTSRSGCYFVAAVIILSLASYAASSSIKATTTTTTDCTRTTADLLNPGSRNHRTHRLLSGPPSRSPFLRANIQTHSPHHHPNPSPNPSHTVRHPAHGPLEITRNVASHHRSPFRFSPNYRRTFPILLNVCVRRHPTHLFVEFLRKVPVYDQPDRSDETARRGHSSHAFIEELSYGVHKDKRHIQSDRGLARFMSEPL